MADFTKNITNTVRCFGGAPPTRWGDNFGQGYTMTWGTSKWGEGSVTFITRSDWSIVILNDLPTAFDYYGAQVRTRVDNTLTVDSENAAENLKDGSGVWTYVFVSDTSNAETRAFTTWDQGNDQTVSFTCQAAASTVWS